MPLVFNILFIFNACYSISYILSMINEFNILKLDDNKLFTICTELTCL